MIQTPAQPEVQPVIYQVTALVSKVLQIPKDAVGPDLRYRSIMAWDSLAHVSLMVELEQEFGVTIDSETITSLDSVAAIVRFIETGDPGNLGMTRNNGRGSTIPNQGRVHRGLADVHFDTTAISAIDGRAGTLHYRGYDVTDLVAHASFEETAYLLLHTDLPSPTQLATFAAQLRAERDVPGPVLALLRLLPDAHPMEALRTALSALAAFDPDRSDSSPDALQRRAIRLISQVPTLVAAHHAARAGHDQLAPDPALSHAANYLWLLTGEVPTERVARIVEQVFILHADHSANASTFAARVAASTRSDVYAALTSAVATFAGALHGGAIEKVLSLVQEIGEPGRAQHYVRRLQARNQPVMGFGHRVYKSEDPRAPYLRATAQALSAELGQPQLMAILDAVVEAMRPYGEKGIHVNVDFYAGAIYHLLGLPQDLFVSTFAVGRTPGWLAQINEQYANNILIRPLLDYVGPIRRRHPACG